MTLLREREQAVVTLRNGRRWDWERFLLWWASAFHALAAVTLAAAPYDQIYNAGTKPILDMGSRYLWAILFALAAVAVGFAARRPHPGVTLFVAALAIFPLACCWLCAFGLAVAQGHGSALSVVIWTFLEGPWSVAVLRVGLGKR